MQQVAKRETYCNVEVRWLAADGSSVVRVLITTFAPTARRCRGRHVDKDFHARQISAWNKIFGSTISVVFGHCTNVTSHKGESIIIRNNNRRR